MKMTTTSISSSRILFSSLVVILFMSSIDTTQAKRGCSAFGHSCFGGHGKRSDTPGGPSDPEEVPLGLQPPGSDVAALLGGRGAVELFSRDQGQLDGNDIAHYQYRPLEAEDYVRIAPIFRKWVRF